LPYLILVRHGAIPALHIPAGTLGANLELAAAHPLWTYVVRPRPASADGYYFAGWCCGLLALLGALAPGRAPECRSARTGLVCVALAGWLLSLGFAWELPGGGRLPLPLAGLAQLVPGFGSLRAPLRLGVIAAVALPALAGLGFARLEGRLTSRAARTLLCAAVAAVALLEAVPRSMPLRPVPVGDQVPEAYRWLAEAPGGPVLELPVNFLDRNFRGDIDAVRWHSAYEYLSTVHWRPLLNGYSGYPPESFYFLMAIARRLPARDPLQDLVDLSGLRWLVVHRRWLPPAERASWDRAGEVEGLVRRGTFGDDLVFEVALQPRRDLVPALRATRAQPTTLNDLSRDPLPPACLVGSVSELEVPPAMLAGAVARGRLTMRNLGACIWPGFDPARRGLVNVAYRWRGEGGEAVEGRPVTRTGRDLGPGDSLRVPFAVLAPSAPGRYELAVTLRQDGGAWFDAAGIGARTAVEIRAWPPGSRGVGGSEP
jgi:hypothetical protein